MHEDNCFTLSEYVLGLAYHLCHTFITALVFMLLSEITATFVLFIITLHLL